jgi:hypothetical protein
MKPDLSQPQTWTPSRYGRPSQATPEGRSPTRSRATGSTRSPRPGRAPTCASPAPTGRSAPGCCCCPAGGGCARRRATGPSAWHDRLDRARLRLGAFLMRGAGCTWNDITDRDIDGAWRAPGRGRSPRGRSPSRQALAWMVARRFSPSLILLTFNTAAIRWASPRWCRSRSIPSPSASPGGRRSSSGWPSTGARCWPGRRIPDARPGRRCCSTPRASPGRCSTTRSTPIRTSEDDALIGVKSTARLFGDRTESWLRCSCARRTFLAGAACVGAVVASVAAIERRSPRACAARWRSTGRTGSRSRSTGSRCILSGLAPDEATALRAVSPRAG